LRRQQQSHSPRVALLFQGLDEAHFSLSLKTIQFEIMHFERPLGAADRQAGKIWIVIITANLPLTGMRSIAAPHFHI